MPAVQKAILANLIPTSKSNRAASCLSILLTLRAEKETCQAQIISSGRVRMLPIRLGSRQS